MMSGPGRPKASAVRAFSGAPRASDRGRVGTPNSGRTRVGSPNSVRVAPSHGASKSDAKPHGTFPCFFEASKKAVSLNPLRVRGGRVADCRYPEFVMGEMQSAVEHHASMAPYVRTVNLHTWELTASTESQFRSVEEKRVRDAQDFSACWLAFTAYVREHYDRCGKLPDEQSIYAWLTYSEKGIVPRGLPACDRFVAYYRCEVEALIESVRPLGVDDIEVTKAEGWRSFLTPPDMDKPDSTNPNDYIKQRAYLDIVPEAVPQVTKRILELAVERKLDLQIKIPNHTKDAQLIQAVMRKAFRAVLYTTREDIDAVRELLRQVVREHRAAFMTASQGVRFSQALDVDGSLQSGVYMGEEPVLGSGFAQRAKTLHQYMARVLFVSILQPPVRSGVGSTFFGTAYETMIGIFRATDYDPYTNRRITDSA